MAGSAEPFGQYDRFKAILLVTLFLMFFFFFGGGDGATTIQRTWNVFRSII